MTVFQVETSERVLQLNLLDLCGFPCVLVTLSTFLVEGASAGELLVHKQHTIFYIRKLRRGRYMYMRIVISET